MRNLLRLIALPLALAGSGQLFAQGFQGMSWGADIKTIRRSFPLAVQAPDDGAKIADCNSANGSLFKCTVSQQMCQSLEVNCH